MAEGWRRRGLARRLLREALRRAGGLRIDLITRSGDFYLGLGGRPGPGFRLTWEGLGLADRATPLDHPISVTGGHHPSDRAAMRGRQYMDAAIEQTGAVVMGRRTFEMGDPDSYERLRLEKLEVHEIGARTSLGFRILDR